MKKVLFLMFLLLLMGLGAAGVKAQVRIGGDGAPNAAAVLDLNANDDATPAGNKGALALPRVSLASTTAQLNGATPISGMLVYNTNASMTGGSGVGMYFWDGSSWVRVAPYVATPSGALTWTISFSGVLTIPALGQGVFASISVPGLHAFDICSSPSARYIINATDALAYVCNVGAATTAQTAIVTCYHPVPSN